VGIKCDSSLSIRTKNFFFVSVKPRLELVNIISASERCLTLLLDAYGLYGLYQVKKVLTSCFSQEILLRIMTNLPKQWYKYL